MGTIWAASVAMIVLRSLTLGQRKSVRLVLPYTAYSMDQDTQPVIGSADQQLALWNRIKFVRWHNIARLVVAINSDSIGRYTLDVAFKRAWSLRRI